MTIQINDRWRIEQDQYNFIPYIYTEGGRKYRNLKTGQTEVSKPSWKSLGRYYPTLNKALLGILHYEMEVDGRENSVEIRDYIKKMETIAETLAKYRK